MLDVNYLNSYSKEYSKEVAEIRNFVSLINEVKSYFNHFRNINEQEGKTLDQLAKNLINLNRNIVIDMQLAPVFLEDFTQLSKIVQSFMNVFENLGKAYNDDTRQVNLISNTLNDLNEDSSQVNKMIQDGLVPVLKDLTKARTKHRTITGKADTCYKELENLIQSKKNIETDKNVYNLTVREKLEEKIINSLDQILLLKASQNEAFDDVIKNESLVNEQLNLIFKTITALVFDFVNKFKLLYQDIANIKASTFSLIGNFTNEAVNELFNTPLDLDDIEVRFCQYKNIEFSN